MPRIQVLVVVAMFAPSVARAQFGGSRPGGPGAPGAPTAPPGETKEEGPAEAAPEAEQNPLLPPLPSWPQQSQKTLQFFQLSGYMRFRWYFLHNLNLGVFDSPQMDTSHNPILRSPFPTPSSDYGSSGVATDNNPPGSCAATSGSNCRNDSLNSADMRLRLEPTINVSEQVRVKAQVDVFDNLVLGSTPNGYFLTRGSVPQNAPTAVFSNSQDSPESGVNGLWSSIRAKRAWAEVQTPFGLIAFGRMGNHFGTGMSVNDGGGGAQASRAGLESGPCLDCDYGQNVDRLSFETKRIWSHTLRFSWDFAASGPTTQIIRPTPVLGQGVFYDSDRLLGVGQWTLVIGRFDKREDIKERVDAGKVVLNYGAYLSYRQQDWSLSYNPGQTVGTADNTAQTLQLALAPRHALIFLPNLWGSLDWKKLHLEMEAAMVVGNIGNLSDVYPTLKPNQSTLIVAGGFVAKGAYALLRDSSLKLHAEVGFASGDDSEDGSALVNFQNAVRAPVNNRIGRFQFDPDYHVDLILFRRILGAVSNAAYYKVGASYDLLERFGVRADLIHAMAVRPVGYPGNAPNLGVELDAKILYKNEDEGFYAGLAYGVLFSLDGLGIRRDIYSVPNTISGGIAQTLQAWLAVKFDK